MKRVPLFVVAAAALAAAGCGSSSGKTVAVKGTVTLDSKPMPEGEISFFGEGETPQTLEIKAGAFEGQVKTGKKRVEIRAYKEGATMPAKGEMYKDKKPPGGTSRENIIPARFNSNSKLTAEASASGLEPHDFKVESK